MEIDLKIVYQYCSIAAIISKGVSLSIKRTSFLAILLNVGENALVEPCYLY